jgi:hypothetical protein
MHHIFRAFVLDIDIRRRLGARLVNLEGILPICNLAFSECINSNTRVQCLGELMKVYSFESKRRLKFVRASAGRPQAGIINT